MPAQVAMYRLYYCQSRLITVLQITGFRRGAVLVATSFVCVQKCKLVQQRRHWAFHTLEALTGPTSFIHTKNQNQPHQQQNHQ